MIAAKEKNIKIKLLKSQSGISNLTITQPFNNKVNSLFRIEDVIVFLISSLKNQYPDLQFSFR